jgi:4-amino-4-deoxy-L-arabinose transferase-like glycosyltransferase
MFSKGVGIISALLYSVSPLAVLYSRTPYHTSPIPLFTILYFYSLFKFIRGNKVYFPLTILFLAILYNFELATVILWFILFIVLAYGIWMKKAWVRKIFGKKILLFSLISIIIPMFPVLLYDIDHGFPQTLGFVAWIGYRFLRFFGFPSISGVNGSTNFSSIFNYFLNFYQNLVFAQNNIIAMLILTVSLCLLIATFYKYFKLRNFDIGFTLLLLWLLISFIGYFVNQTSSGAYLPILFPAVIYLTAFSLSFIMAKKSLIIPVILLIIVIVSTNSYTILVSDYSVKGVTYSKRLSLAKKIINIADKRNYNIIGAGPGSQFQSFTMNYEYLAWWLGQAPSKSPQKIKFIIQENSSGVELNSIQINN